MRSGKRIFKLAMSLIGVLVLAPLHAQLPATTTPTIAAYVIDAELAPADHHLTATATVSFTVAENAAQVTFDFHPALKIPKVTDETGKLLDAQRAADGSLRVTPATALTIRQLTRWTFSYEGTITGSNDGPIAGMKTAAIQEPVSYLLYAARWFPTTGYLTHRFTAEMHIRVPRGMQVIASGSLGAGKPVILADGKQGDQFDFNWSKSGFPGSVIAGRFANPDAIGASNIKLYLAPNSAQSASELAQKAEKELTFFTDRFSAAESSRLYLVELPDDAQTAVWAPELAAVSTSQIANERLLASTIAHQWWGSAVSPRTLNDAWIVNGMARYSELLFLEDENGATALKSALADIAAGALAYDTIPLASASRVTPFSTEFQSMTLEKGAMIFHMLRGEIGDKAFLATLKIALTHPMIDAAEFEKIAETQSQKPLGPFFAQWVDGTGAPRFINKYAVYRLGNNQGFRVVGEIDQDLDLFRMPIELSIETDGKTEVKKMEAVGTNSQYSVETFGRPRHIVIDPDGWVLKSTPENQVRVSILRGLQLTARGDLNGALAQYQEALEVNPQSSLVNFRIGELLYKQHNYQASANAYRDALRGDGEPHWTEVWSHIALGKIFDVTGQRDRAINEYRLAAQTNDNAQGAVNEAQQYLQKPFALSDEK